MTPRELLDRLEGLGSIEPKVIAKIRREIENPEKNVKPKAILRYLAQKGYITEAQSANLLNAIVAPKPVKHEEIEVVAPQENTYDTDDLTSTAREVVEEIDAGRTVEEVEVEQDDEDDHLEVDVVEVTRPTVQPVVEVVEHEAPLHDPLDGELEHHFEDPLHDQQTDRQTKSVLGFRGKRLKKDQWATKWLYIGFGILGSLLIFGAVLYIAVSRVSAEDQFKAANNSFENGAYSDAIEKFTKFVDDNPRHEKTNMAKVRRVHALIAQTYEDKNWDETISRAENQLPILLDDPEINMELIRDDLGVMLPGAALKMSERALKQTELSAMESQLALAQNAKTIVDNPSYIPNSIRKRPLVASTIDRLENNILNVQGLIQKENDYTTGLVEIKRLGNSGKTDEAFALFQKLTRQYGELATREELQTAMKAVSAKERELVIPLQTKLKTLQSSRDSDSQDLIVLSSQHGSRLDANRDLISLVLAEGTLYGIDSSDGRVVWRKWLGFQTHIQPQLFSEDLVLIADQLNNDVMLVKRLDGQVIWRTEIGEPFVQPAFSPSMVVVTARSGKIFKLDALTGSVVAAVQLPQEASVSALIAEREPYIYQPGNYSNIYILSSDDLSCRDVYYLGHYKGSIEVPPQYWNGHLIVCVNGGSRCDLYVLKPEEQGLGLNMVQLMNRITSGPVTTPPQRFGRWLLVASDNGDLKILNIDPSNEAIPISKFAEEKFENRSGQHAFLKTQGSQLWIAGKGILKYRIQGSLGKFNRQVFTNHGDSFIAPLQVIEDGLIHVRRRDGSGMVSVSAVDPNSLEEIWRTDLGGALAGQPRIVGGLLQAISNQGDLFRLDAEAMKQGYSHSPVKSSTIVEDLTFENTVDLGGDRFACVGPLGRDDLLYIEAGNSRLLKLQPPANRPACQPIAVGGDLIVASREGQVVRVDPRTGRMMGAPFQPPVQPGTKVNWKRPVLIQDQVFAIAQVSPDGAASSLFLLDASDGKSIRKIASVDFNSEIKSPLAAMENSILVVISGDGGDQLAVFDAANSLTAKGSAALNGGYVAGPWVVGQSILVAVDTDELICFDKQLNEKWKIGLPNDRLAGEPVSDRGNIALAFRSGRVDWLDPATGKSAESIELGQPISGVNFVENKLYFGGLDGTVHVWQAQ